MSEQLFAITISHQLCSGGSFLGQRLADHLGVPFVNRQILQYISEKLHVAESVVEQREERLSSFWESFSRLAVYTNPSECLSMENYLPTDRELFDLESTIIARIAEKKAAVFLGRCGRYILRNHPRCFNILVHADLPERIASAQKLYCVEAAEARKLLETNDRERSAYVSTFTHQDPWDARGYDLIINMSKVGREAAVEITLQAVKRMLNEG
ncbi:cytidylate kinase [Longilinea arvoryzae]|uniref:Cytidylate kinase n=1 Tax=Longilinea arvoryzae TaxID=360412 RepID=A0A0K8MXU7_9CHLR|nr:cytidylate kinase-like family protein [Longilinea arvoryzae]GAP16079.1 cytidylate kinase [Longilinea arvoryzae]